MSLTSLKALSELKVKQAGLSQQRHQRSEAALEQGLRHLATVLEDPGQKQALVLASESFLDTIRCNRREPAGYVAMAHVFLLLNQPREALPYLHEARRVAPKDPDVALMFAHIQGLGASAPDAQHRGDADFDRLEQTLAAEVRKQMAQPALLWKPDLDAERTALLDPIIAGLEAVLANARPALAGLERAYETAPLTRLMQQIELLLMRYGRLRDQCRAFQTLAAEVGRDARQAERLARELQAGPASDFQFLECGLDALLDQCDRHADRLDAWERDRLDIAPVKPVYKQLILRVTALQNLFDDIQPSESAR